MNYKFYLFLSNHKIDGLKGFKAFSIAVLLSSFFSPFAMAQSLNQEIRGNTGGGVNSGDCGFISSNPHHVINLSEQAYSLHLRVEASQGHPTLLIVGPSNGDRTCILGDVSAGRHPQMGGVWAPGRYSIYVGDTQGSQYPFTLRVQSH